MASLAVFIGFILASNFLHTDFSIEKIFLGLASAFLVTGAGNTINDYFDYKIDKKNSPDRPIPSGEISRNKALFLSITLFLIGISASIFLNYLCFLLALFNSFLLFFYARNLKGIPLIGNFSVGYLVGSTFLFGALILEKIEVTMILFILATFSTIGREIAKDIEDIEGDKSLVKTVATEYGINTSSKLATVFSSFAVIISPLPYLLDYLGLSYLIIVLIADFLFVLAIKNLFTNQNIKSAHKFQKYSKYAMSVSLISFLIGSIGF